MNSFQTALAHVFAQEGGYVDHPDDPGGATKYGITRKTLARFRGIHPWSKLPKTDVRNMRKSEASQIYYRYYWHPIYGSKLPAGLAFCLFDFAVNSGPARAIKTLQALVKVPPDGRMGPITLAAIKTAIAMHAEAHLIEQLSTRRLRFLQGLRHYATFGRGWRKRVQYTRQRALEIAQTNSTPTTSTRKNMIYLQGYKTYITAALMLIIGLAQLVGIEVPAFDTTSAGHLVMEAFAIIFLRKGLKESALG